MKDIDGTIVPPMHQKSEAGCTRPTANQDTIPLDKGKPPTVKTDDWLVELLCSLWYSHDRSSETRDIVESNVNLEEADIANGLFSVMPWELHNKLQKRSRPSAGKVDELSSLLCLGFPSLVSFFRNRR